MNGIAERRPRAAASSTRSVGSAARRARFWFGFAAVALAFVVLAMVVRGAAVGAADRPLAADNPAPSGARALVEVLRAHGVNVVSPVSRDGVEAALAAHPDAAVFVYDQQHLLSGQEVKDITGEAKTLVLMTPGPDVLDAVADGIRSSGAAEHSSDLPARCDDAAAERAGTLTAPGRAFRVTGEAHGCFPAGGDTFATATIEAHGRRVTALGSVTAFDNEHIARSGNAAYAIGLLGAHRTLVWYLPTLRDATATGAPNLAELTPGWVSPAIVLLIACAFAAIAWRGRRFGPLVAESLPVTVRARETMEGRARLYQRSDARLRAADNLRIGAIGRLAARLALSRSASAGEVADAVAARLGRHPDAVRALLIETEPADDRALMRLSDELAELESSLTASVTHDGPRRSGTDHNADDSTGE